MGAITPHERLRHARTLRGEDVAALTARTGLRAQHVRAIEEGRYADLPPGIYGRAAIRAFAAAYALDADAVLAECEPLLPRIEDPIDALARRRGCAHAPAVVVATNVQLEAGWRPLAAASIDGAVAGGVILAASAAAALLARVSLAALETSATPFFVVGVVLGAAYYVWLGGLRGTTLGERVIRWRPQPRDPRPLTLAAIARRALFAATADARAIYGFGQWAGRRFRPSAARSARPPAPLPSQPPPPGRAEALTWSVNRRASVPPPPLRPRRG